MWTTSGMTVLPGFDSSLHQNHFVPLFFAATRVQHLCQPRTQALFSPLLAGRRDPGEC